MFPARCVQASLLAVVSFACAGSATLVLKTPAQQQCTSAGLKGCEEMTQGLMTYLEGNEQEGKALLIRGAAKNSPDDLRKYAMLVKTLQGAPGADQYIQPLGEIADILLAQADAPVVPKVATSVVAAASPAAAADTPNRTVTADTDPEQARHGALLAPQVRSDWCRSSFGERARCAPITRGPLFVTDLHSLGSECRGQVVAFTGGDNAAAIIDGPLAIHGARHFLPAEHLLTLVQFDEDDLAAPSASSKGRPAPEAGNRSCGLLWNGFEPYDLRTSEEKRDL